MVTKRLDKAVNKSHDIMNKKAVHNPGKHNGQDDLGKIMDFMLFADRLKEVDRTGWSISEVNGHEDVGDHSYSTAVLSYLFGLRLGLDAERCALMGLFHDINEILTGDIATRADKRMQSVEPRLKKRMERSNELKLISRLPKKEMNAVGSLLKELYGKETAEAKLVKQVDKLDYVLQLLPYNERIRSDERVREFFDTAGTAITIPEVRDIYERVKAELYKKRGIK